MEIPILDSAQRFGLFLLQYGELGSEVNSIFESEDPLYIIGKSDACAPYFEYAKRFLEVFLLTQSKVGEVSFERLVEVIHMTIFPPDADQSHAMEWSQKLASKVTPYLPVASSPVEGPN